MRTCPKCKSNDYAHRALVMMINECGHPLCQNCVDNIFARNAGRCPYDGCERILKKNNFWEQVFDDPAIEKENYIRKRVLKTYNLMEDNFSSLREFNDYLEHVEEIVWKLGHDEDVQAVEEEMRTFREKNAEAIERNRRRKNADEQWIDKQLEEERRALSLKQAEPRDDNDHDDDIDNKPRSIIMELRDSDLPAEMILDRERKVQIEAEMAEKEEREKKKRERSGRRRQVQDTASFSTLRVTGAAYMHKLPTLPINGPPMPDMEAIKSMGYLNHVRAPNKAALAGGFRPELACFRALFELRWDFNPDN